MYAQAAIKPNTLLRNGAYGIVMRGVKKCTCAGASLRRRNSAPLCCIKLDTATDPASGSGNFLTETYVSIRRLENEAISARFGGQMTIGDVSNPIQVSIRQFHGIEINDFAVTVAKTALWIAESQMMQETENILYGKHLEFLTLKTNANIVEANALRIDWNEVIPAEKFDYIMGNSPFVGVRLMNASQKDDVNNIFENWKNAGNLDHVCCWYKKAADYMTGTNVTAALVSTNSVTQGENMGNL